MSDLQFGLRTYPWEFTEETLEERLSRFGGLGIERLTCAVLYHDARQVLPDGPGRHFVWVAGGRSYVPVRPELYPAGLAPQEGSFGLSLNRISEAARAMGFDFVAWSVSLHRDDLLRQALDDPQSVGELPFVENAWGEPHWAHLCPSTEASSGYLLGHLQDVEASGASAIQLEGANFPTYAHGAHHESLFVPLSEHEKWLASLCFCASCRAAAAEVDTDGLAAQVRDLLEARFAGGNDDVGSMAETDGFVCARQRVVTDLITRLSSTSSSLKVQVSTQVTIAGTLFYSGQHASVPAAVRGPLYGLDYSALEAVSDGMVILGYVRDHEAFESHIDAYIDLGVKPERATVVLRPMTVDCAGPRDFERRLCFVIERGFRKIDFPHFFARPSEVAMVADAIERL